jgi:uncharacterized protein (TIGR02246 family)
MGITGDSSDTIKIIDLAMAAYNSRNAQALADLFASDVVIFEHPGVLVQQGQKGVLEHYEKVFKQTPLASVEVVHRIVLGDWVMVHEKMRQSPDHLPVEVVAMYQIQNRFIKRLDFIRKL